MRSILYFATLLGTAMAAGCPYMSGEHQGGNEGANKRQNMNSVQDATMATQEFLAPFELNDTNVYMTTDFGTPISESVSLKAGARGPTLLEDFIFRQKLQRFDHERVSKRLFQLCRRLDDTANVSESDVIILTFASLSDS
jgi:catalase